MHVQFQKKSIPTPDGRLSEIPRGRGVLQAKILEAKYEAKLEFPGRQEVQIKTLPWGRVYIDISGNAQFYY